jgi:PKD repeat protein
MKLKQTTNIILISIILSSLTAVTALAHDDKYTDTNMYDTDSDAKMYDTDSDAKMYDTDPDAKMYDTNKDTTTYDTASDTTTIKSKPEVVASNLIAAFTATHDPNRPLTIRFREKSIGKPVPYTWGTKYGTMTYFWGFGDKSTSILQNPVHPFKEPGKYKVYLRIQNAEGEVSKAVMYINVRQ